MSSQRNFVAEIEARAATGGWLDRPAYQSGGETHSYRELFRRTAEVSGALRRRGIGPGDRIALVLPEDVEQIVLFLAALRVGAVAVPFSGILTAAEASTTVQRIRPALVVRRREFEVPAGTAALSPEELRAEASDDTGIEQVDADAPSFAVFTSGSTGPAKLATHTHGDIFVFDEVAGAAIGITAEDVTLSASSLHLAYGLGNTIFFPLLRGGSVVLKDTYDRLDHQLALDLIDRYSVSVFYSIPTYFGELLREENAGALGRLRLLVTAGEVLNATLEKQLIEVVGAGLTGIFGTTEIGHAVTVNGGANYRPQKVGQVIAPYQVRVVDRTTGAVLEPGRIGAIEIKGPTISLGNREPADPVIRLVEEWYGTGDVAVLDEDGYVQLFGRLDDVETVRGLDVFPAEVESVILENPAIREAAVATVAAPDGERRVWAYVVREPAPISDVELADLVIKAVAEQLEEHKVPHGVRFVTELPYVYGGKLSRREVRALG
ncbi:class I adenylate-forming enzyme family protein [Nocardia jejuensis]|uniref:class I adenylate-forming enzyme family protein n=1 Tax=Nocardia jejuensis TaxID=328049 RepID=UPI00082968AE|nr:AMP-binding protein [Nocardia jejuensis]